MKFSVIIPTMWRCQSIFIPFLKDLVSCDEVDEILIIDNDSLSRPSDFVYDQKIKIFEFGRNIYCNPAWNIGVNESRNDLLCIVNDDLRFDLKLFSKVRPFLTPDNGITGLSPGIQEFNQPQIKDHSINIRPWAGEHTYGFGCLFFLHKSCWKDIPAGLDLYFGDNFIFDLQLFQGKTNFIITDLDFATPFAATTGDPGLSRGFLERERIIYEKVRTAMNHREFFQREYESAANTISDIYKHVPVLNQLAQECDSVVELGVRTGVSTRAFLNSNVRLRSYDIEIDREVDRLFDIARLAGKDCQYIMGDSLAIDIEEADMLFVDTIHNYHQVRGELERHGHKIRKYIAFHDTYIFGLNQENILSAVIEYMRDNPEWHFKYYTIENSGLTVIERRQANIAPINKKRLLIALPTNKNVETETLKSIYDLEVPADIETELQFFYGYQIDQVRNLIADWGKRYDYLFCVDSDIVLPKDSLKKMLAADKDVISGLYIQRIPGEQNLELYKANSQGGADRLTYSEVAGKGILELGACGFGCVLIKSHVLRTMTYPHFVYRSAIDHANTFSEDIFFCIKAREAGFKIWADTSILCDHIGSTKFKIDNQPSTVSTESNNQDRELERFIELSKIIGLPDQHKGYLYQLAEQHKIRPKVIYDIGACVLHWSDAARDIWPDSKIIPFDATSGITRYYRHCELTEYHEGVLTDIDNKPLVFFEKIADPGGNSYYIETTGQFTNEDAVQKFGMTLDTIVAQKGFPYPDMIKLDTQGSELDILKGANKCLENCYDIILEAQHADYNQGAPKVGAVIEYLNSIGFRLISNFTHGPVDGDYHFKRYR